MHFSQYFEETAQITPNIWWILKSKQSKAGFFRQGLSLLTQVGRLRVSLLTGPQFSTAVSATNLHKRGTGGKGISLLIKFIYSEKATKFCKISTNYLSYVVPVKCKVKISQNFVAFSEYMNFKDIKLCVNFSKRTWKRISLIQIWQVQGFFLSDLIVSASLAFLCGLRNNFLKVQWKNSGSLWKFLFDQLLCFKSPSLNTQSCIRRPLCSTLKFGLKFEY